MLVAAPPPSPARLDRLVADTSAAGSGLSQKGGGRGVRPHGPQAGRGDPIGPLFVGVGSSVSTGGQSLAEAAVASDGGFGGETGTARLHRRASRACDQWGRAHRMCPLPAMSKEVGGTWRTVAGYAPYV